MKPHDTRALEPTKPGEQPVGNPQESSSTHDNGSGPNGYSPVINQLMHNREDNDAQWRERGRIAFCEGRELKAAPFGTVNLSVEGVLRERAWIAGWSAAATAKVKRSLSSPSPDGKTPPEPS